MDIAGILGTVLGILGIFYAIDNNRQLTRSVKIISLRRIRTLINRMEEEKSKHSSDSPQRNAMHHTQQELDALFKDLQTMFNIPDKDAPLV